MLKRILTISISVVFIGVAVFIGILFFGGTTKSGVARVPSDLRSLATAIETYFVDNDAYPAATTDPDLAVFTDHPEAGSFRRSTDGLYTLTTPIPYITRYFADPYSDLRGGTFHYWNWHPKEGEEGEPVWILWSALHDVDLDLSAELLEREGILKEWSRKLSAEDDPTPPEKLILKTYDPTNGTNSDGDYWRLNRKR